MTAEVHQKAGTNLIFLQDRHFQPGAGLGKPELPRAIFFGKNVDFVQLIKLISIIQGALQRAAGK